MPSRERRGRWLAWGLALAAFLWVLRSPINQAGSDPRGSLLVSQALLETGSIRLDDYVDEADLPSRNLVEHDGRVDYLFPLGVPLAALPAVGLARRLGLDMVDPLDEARLHKWLAALTVALVLLLAWRLAEELLDGASDDGPSSPATPFAPLIVAAVAVLGSGLTSTLGTAFWSNDVAAALNLLALVLLVEWVGLRPATAGPASRTEPMAPERDPRSARGPLRWGRALLLGLVLFAAALARPSSALLAGLALLYVAWVRGWGSAARLTLGMGLPALAFFGVSLWDYGHPLPPYYRPSRLSGTDSFGEALLGNLVSPGRGLLVFSPWVGVVLVGALARGRRLARRPLFWLASAWASLHLLAISGYPHWWDGHSYGGRPFVEALPALLLLALLVWRELARGAAEREAGAATGRGRRMAIAAFLLLGGFSIWVHAWKGLYDLHTVMWNGGDWGPELGDINVDRHPEYLWDWRHPQMLASEASLKARYREHRLRQLPVLEPGRGLLATSDPRHFAGEGWQPAEGEGAGAWRWTEGRWREGDAAPALVFRLMPERLERLDAGARLVLEAGTARGQALDLILNGERIGRFETERHFEPRQMAFELPPGLLDEANRLEIRAPDAREAGGGDPRLLGMAFRGMRLED